MKTLMHMCCAPCANQPVAALREEAGENRKQELLAQFNTVAGELRCLGMTNAQLFEVLLGGDPS